MAPAASSFKPLEVPIDIRTRLAEEGKGDRVLAAGRLSSTGYKLMVASQVHTDSAAVLLRDYPSSGASFLTSWCVDPQALLQNAQGKASSHPGLGKTAPEHTVHDFPDPNCAICHSQEPDPGRGVDTQR